MKKTLIKILSVMLVVIITLTSAPLSGFVGLELPEWLDFSIDASATETSGTCGDYLTWYLDESMSELIILGTGEMYEYSTSNRPWESYEDTIETIIIEDGVTSIGKNAFFNFDLLTNITIPDSVTIIGDRAFFRCTSLTSVTIPDSVTTIGNYVFSNCTSLTNVTIPDSVTTIGDWIFHMCTSLTSVTISDGVTTIGNYVFSRCTSLTNVTIPDSVATIGNSAFSGCTSLTSVTIPDSVTSICYHAFYNTGIYKDSSNWENNVLYIGNHLIEVDKSISNHCKIKEGIKTIAEKAFDACTGLVSVSIPESIISVGDSAFNNCNGIVNTYYAGTETQWNNIAIGSGNDNFTKNVVYECYDVYITGSCGENLTYILYTDGELVISGTGTMTDYISDSSVPWYDYRSSIKSVTFEEGITNIGSYAFNGCTGLTAITIPDSVTSIGDDAFYNTGYYNDASNWENNVLYIDEYLIEVKDTITDNCTIKRGTKVIADSAFYNCTKLISMMVPVSVTSVGDSAFSNCNGIVNTCYEGTETQWNNIAIGSNNDYFTEYVIYEFYDEERIYLIGSCGENLTYILYMDGELVIRGTGAMTDYTSSSIPWYDYRSSIKSVTFKDGITSIGNSAFYSCDSLTSITIGNGVTIIGDWAFAYCDSLTSVTIPDSVTTIGDSAFVSCDSLTSVTIPDSVTTIGNYAFYSTAYYNNSSNWENNVLYIDNHLIKAKTSLTGEYVIKEGTVSVSANAFGDCTKLTDIHIPLSVKYFNNDSFKNCSGLKTVSFYGETDDWCKIVFDNEYSNPMRYASNLYIDGMTVKGNIVIPDGVTVVSDYLFKNCTGITSVTIPDSVTSIGNNTFYGCTGLTTVSIPDSVTTIGDYAFRYCESLTIVTIPDSVTTIGDYAFSVCTNLKTVNITDVSAWCNIAFNGYYSNPLYNGANLYLNGTKVTNLVIPDSVTTIGDYAFYNCTGLTSVTIPDSVTTIGGSAFAGCSKISKTYYTGTVVQWSKISIGSYNTYLTKNVIYDCNSMRTRQDMGTCGEGLEWVLYTDGELVISGTGDMTDYDLSSVAPWDSSKSVIKFVTINDGVASIGDYAFNNISGIETVVIPAGVNDVGVSAFAGVSGLTDVYYSGTESEWNEITIGSANGYLKNANKIFEHEHDYVQVVVKSPTCKVTGTCKLLCDCGSLLKYEELPLAEHIAYDSWTTTVSPDCLNDGVAIKKCKVCYIELESKTLEALGHTESDWIETTPSDCVTEGTAIKKCTVCDAQLDIKSIDTISHTYDVLVDSSQYPQSSHNYSNNISQTKTFTYEGATQLVITFSTSTKVESKYDYIYVYDGSDNLIGKYTGTELAGKILTISGDTFKIKLTSDSSNTFYGYSFTSIVATGQDWFVITEPDCETVGQKGRTCVSCGLTAETQEIPALGHTEGEWIETISADCVNDGTAIKKCTVCDVKLETKVIDALGHTDGEWTITVAPTTSTEGQKELSCSVCGDLLKTEKVDILAPICDSISWEIVDGGAVITDSEKNLSGDVVIPQEISGYPVTTIGDGAFAGRTDITSITIPEGVITIGECAFAYCEGVTEIIIPSSVTSIGATAFIGCINLENVDIDDNEKYSTDENGVIYNKDKTTIIYAPKKAVGDAYVMPETVNYATECAFIDCSDFVITLSDNFYDVDLFVFDYLSVSEFKVNSTNRNFTVIDGVLYNKDVTEIIKYPVDSKRELFVMPESVIESDWYYVFCADYTDLASIKYEYGCSDIATDMDYMRTPENLTVHIHEKFDINDYILNGPAHVCFDYMTQAEFENAVSILERMRNEYLSETAEIKAEVISEYGKDSAEYMLIEKFCNDYVSALTHFADCGGDHTRLHPTATITENKDTTCIEDGYIKYHCEDCGYKFEVTTKASGHNFIDGTCSVCGEKDSTAVIIGDVNDDGKVNTLDRVILTRYIAKWDEYPEGSINTIAADVNGDGKVNTLDRVILTRYIAKWEGYETLPYSN